MKKNSIHFLKGLAASSLAGGLLGSVLWAAGSNALAPVVLALGAVLFYLHRRWLKRINNSGDDIKLKHLG